MHPKIFFPNEQVLLFIGEMIYHFYINIVNIYTTLNMRMFEC